MYGAVRDGHLAEGSVYERLNFDENDEATIARPDKPIPRYNQQKSAYSNVTHASDEVLEPVPDLRLHGRIGIHPTPAISSSDPEFSSAIIATTTTSAAKEKEWTAPIVIGR
jgi:hypothetical protein